MTYKDFFRKRQEAFKDFERFAACGSLSAGQPAGSTGLSPLTRSIAPCGV
jgi:hypothetical protein